MSQNKNQSILRCKYFTQLCNVQISSNQRIEIDGRVKFDLSKYNTNRWKIYFLEVDLEYHQQFRELHNYYLLAPEITKIVKEVLSNYQIKIDDFHKISIDNAKTFVTNVYNKKVCASF